MIFWYNVGILLLVAVLVPIALFGVCALLKKPYYNIWIFGVLLAAAVCYTLFGQDIANGVFPDIMERVRIFWINDSVMILYFLWMPSCIGCLVTNLVYWCVKRRNK